MPGPPLLTARLMLRMTPAERARVKSVATDMCTSENSAVRYLMRRGAEAAGYTDPPAHPQQPVAPPAADVPAAAPPPPAARIPPAHFSDADTPTPKKRRKLRDPAVPTPGPGQTTIPLPDEK